MSLPADQNKKITKDFFEALSAGSEKYLDFYTDDSIIWTAGNNAIGGTRTKEEVVSFAQNILAAFPTGIKFNITGMTADCLLYTSPSPRDKRQSRMASCA